MIVISLGIPGARSWSASPHASPRSCILLVSPVSDDYLWRDVLQQGGYDVLLRPLREECALRAVQAVLRFVSPESGVSVGCER